MNLLSFFRSFWCIAKVFLCSVLCFLGGIDLLLDFEAVACRLLTEASFWRPVGFRVLFDYVEWADRSPLLNYFRSELIPLCVDLL